MIDKETRRAIQDTSEGNGRIKASPVMTNEDAIGWLMTEDYEALGYTVALGLAIRALEQQKTGMWYIRPDGAIDECYCSICKHGFDLDKLKMMWGHYELPPYCPACGAKMEAE